MIKASKKGELAWWLDAHGRYSLGKLRVMVGWG
jgi:hypothetical protein